MTKPTLVYFPVRGRAEPIRLILADAGVDWQEHPIGSGTPAQNGRPTDFAALKASGDLPFEAAPVWEEPDGFRLAQTLAIMSYLGRTHGLHGQTPREQALVDQMLLAIDTDLRPEVRKLMTVAAEARPALRQELIDKTVPRWLGFLDRLIGDRPFVAGERCTIADLSLWYMLELLHDNKLDAGLRQLPRLHARAETIGARPNLAAYVKSARRHPFAPLPV